MFHASKRQKTTPSPSFDVPPKLRDIMDIVPHLPENHTSSDFILNDSFVRIIEIKKKTCTFRALYDNIVVFLLKVSSFYFTFYLFISYFIKFHSYFMTLLHFFLQIIIFIYKFLYLYFIFVGWRRYTIFFQWPIAKKTCCGPHHCGLPKWSSCSGCLGSAILNSALECQHS